MKKILVVLSLSLFGCSTYFEYVNKGYASEAKITIKNIHQKAAIYQQEMGGDYPSDIYELEESGYLSLSETVQKNWEFELNVDWRGQTGTITATSTDEMGGGAGHTVIYDVETYRFSGTLEEGNK